MFDDVKSGCDIPGFSARIFFYGKKVMATGLYACCGTHVPGIIIILGNINSFTSDIVWTWGGLDSTPDLMVILQPFLRIPSS